jgi:hypothetical protein
MEVDGELFNSFMDHAEPNTSRGVETCGILCGVLVSILLCIYRLVILI